MHTVLIVLKTQQMIVCKTKSSKEDESIIYEKPLSMGWMQNKQGGLSMGLAAFPQFIPALIKRAGEIEVPIHASEIFFVYGEEHLKPEVMKTYEQRAQEVYGNIAVVKSFPIIKGSA